MGGSWKWWDRHKEKPVIGCSEGKILKHVTESLHVMGIESQFTSRQTSHYTD
jgi:hypothetical protein